MTAQKVDVSLSESKTKSFFVQSEEIPVSPTTTVDQNAEQLPDSYLTVSVWRVSNMCSGCNLKLSKVE